MKIDYKGFDNTPQSGARPKYYMLHIKLKAILKNKPMNIFELTDALTDGQYTISGQLQFLKSKGIVESKKFEGVYFWGLTPKYRKQEVRL